MSEQNTTPAPQAEPESDKPYTLGSWAGHTQWKCKLCPWDTLVSEDEFMAHYQARHAPPPPPPKPAPLIQAYDRRGNPITPKEE